MLLVDSHCHLDQLDLSLHDNKLANALQAAKMNGVGHFLNVCIDLENFPAVLEIAEQYPYISASVGLHPNTEVASEPSVEALVKLADHPKVIAIGETGLDYFRSTGDVEWQRERFRNHIHAARQIKKPVIIHTRQAKMDTLKIMELENADQIGGIMHCFTEDWAMAEAALAMGFYISFSGIITFKNAIDIQAVAKQVPLDRILIETDSPYLAPNPHRGKSNEPAYVRYVAECLAELRGVSVQQIAEQTTENFFRLFPSLNNGLTK